MNEVRIKREKRNKTVKLKKKKQVKENILKDNETNYENERKVEER